MSTQVLAQQWYSTERTTKKKRKWNAVLIRGIFMCGRHESLDKERKWRVKKTHTFHRWCWCYCQWWRQQTGVATLTSRSLGRPSDARTGKSWAVFLVAGATPAKDIRRESMLVFTRLLGRIFLQPLGPGFAPHGIVLCCVLWTLHGLTKTYGNTDTQMMWSLHDVSPCDTAERILNDLPQLPCWLSTSLMSEDKEDQKPTIYSFQKM